MSVNSLETVAKAMAAPGKGILAADESTGTIEKRLASIKVENTEDSRRAYRELLFSAKGLSQYISGVILYDETLRQKAANGTPFVELLSNSGILPGIKVDTGAKDLAFCPGETVTEGLDNLSKRCAEYVKLGAKFAKWRAVINIGGVSNLTGLPKAGDNVPVVGFDTGPGNLLLDHWVKKHFAMPFDRDGAIAASAGPDQQLIDALLAEPFFAAPPPKSSGRELFSPAWLERALGNRQLEPATVLASLTRLSAVATGRAINRWFPQAADVVVCGGGARNATLLRMLETECAPRPVIASSALGVEPDQVEALAFAWLAKAHVSGQSGNIPSVTGARGCRTLGALYPAR